MLLASLIALSFATFHSEVGPSAPTFETRVLAAESGEPIAAAKLWKIEERASPISGEFWFTAAFSSAPDGLISGQREQDSVWWFIDAEGFAPQAHFGSAPEPTLELRPGREVTLTLVDVFDEPVSGARVSWILGCGHAPDSRSGTTDESGRVVLRGIDPGVDAEWWISDAGVLCEPADPEWSEDRSRALLRCFPAPTREGQLVDADGSPLAGHYVGQPNRHRGPWARTDAEGRFRLFGASDSELQVRDPEGAELGFYPTAVPGFERVIRMGAPLEREATHRLTVRGEDGSPAGGVQVLAIRLADGWSEAYQTNAEGHLELELARGEHVLCVGGEDGAFEPLDLSTSNRIDDEPPLAIQLARRVRVRVIASGRAPMAPVWLCTRSETRDVTSELDDLALPSEECVLWTWTPGGAVSHELSAEDRVGSAIVPLAP